MIGVPLGTLWKMLLGAEMHVLDLQEGGPSGGGKVYLGLGTTVLGVSRRPQSQCCCIWGVWQP